MNPYDRLFELIVEQRIKEGKTTGEDPKTTGEDPKATGERIGRWMSEFNPKAKPGQKGYIRRGRKIKPFKASEQPRVGRGWTVPAGVDDGGEKWPARRRWVDPGRGEKGGTAKTYFSARKQRLIHSLAHKHFKQARLAARAASTAAFDKMTSNIVKRGIDSGDVFGGAPEALAAAKATQRKQASERGEAIVTGEKAKQKFLQGVRVGGGKLTPRGEKRAKTQPLRPHEAN